MTLFFGDVIKILLEVPSSLDINNNQTKSNTIEASRDIALEYRRHR